MASRRCPTCNVFVSVNQLDVAAGDSNLRLVVLGSTATLYDRLVLMCQTCLQEIVNADISFSFEIDHPSTPEHIISGLPISRSPVFEVRDGKRLYGVEVTCSFLCSCNWEGECSIQVQEIASNFSSI